MRADVADLSGRVALVTGGGRGIGRATAIALAAAGADVAVAARSKGELDEVVEAVRQSGRRAEPFVCDVTQRAQVDSTVAAVRQALGDPLILVNNAGIAASAKLADTTDELWDRILRVNATGAFYCTRSVMPLMVQASWGRVINMASVAARAGATYIAAYAASKHALLGLTRAVAAEVATRGITVNAICPGYVDTEMTEQSIRNINARTGRSSEQARTILEGFSPQGRLMTADEIASLAAYLCSDAARGINGQGIVLDGGAVQA
jgi:3-hydroxybutyrate dehydrogenase